MEYQIVITVSSDKSEPEMEDLIVSVSAPPVDEISNKVQFFGRQLAQEIAKDIKDKQAEWTKTINDVNKFVNDYEVQKGGKV